MDRLYTDKESFLYVLDSRNATEYFNGSYHSSVHFDLKEPIKLPKHSIKLSCSVLQFQAPNSLYTVNYTNNKINVTISGIITSYTITNGNYNSNTMITTLLALLPSGFNISLNNITNIFTFTYNQSFRISGSCANILGFPIDGSVSSSIVNSTNTLIMPYTCNFTGLQSFNIHFSSLMTKNIDSYNESPSSIIQSIPIDGSARISYIKNADFSFTIHQELINDVTIDLMDDLHNFLNFNNQHWNLTLYFSIIHDIDRLAYLNSFDSITKFGEYL